VTIANRIRTLRRGKNLTGAKLAELVGTSASHISRIENGKLDPEKGTLLRIARALEVDSAFLKDGHRGIEVLPDPHSDFLGTLIKAKCFADFDQSALASYARLIQAADLYSTRSEVFSRHRHVAESMGELTAINWVADRLTTYTDRQNSEALSEHVNRALVELEQFTRLRGRPIRVGCGILPGAVATLPAMQAQFQALHPDRSILMLDANHASGVETASAAARHARDDAFDFLITSMGSASLTLAGTHDCRHYRPLFPIHYTKQVCLYRPSLMRRPSETKQLFVYAASSGLEEALVRRRELAVKEIVERELFTTLVELIPELDNGQAVNI
jgi:transcriptional regulator with XRE-family HTH domain